MVEYYYDSIHCPKEILDKHNNGFYWRLVPPSPPTTTTAAPAEVPNFLIPKTNDYIPFYNAFYTFKPFLSDQLAACIINVIAVLAILFVLVINRKKRVPNSKLRLFINYFLAFLLYRTISRFLMNLYFRIWEDVRVQMAWCVEETNDKNNETKILYVDNPFEYNYVYPLYAYVFGISIFDVVYDNWEVFEISHNHIYMSQICLCRLVAYCSYVWPLSFKKYFSRWKLHGCYLLIGLFFIAYTSSYYFLDGGFELYRLGFHGAERFIFIFYILFNLAITALTLRLFLQPKTVSVQKSRELKALMAFSIYPMLSTFLSLFFGVTEENLPFLEAKLPYQWIYIVRITHYGSEKFLPFLLCLNLVFLFKT